MSTCQHEFRSFERRRRYLLGPNYKHSTPNRGETCSATNGLDKDPRESAVSAQILLKKQELKKLLRREKLKLGRYHLSRHPRRASLHDMLNLCERCHSGIARSSHRQCPMGSSTLHRPLWSTLV